MHNIIARNNEIETLNRKYNSGKAEFVIIYGRRRIGKTYLVNNVFADRFTFTYVGDRKQKPKIQLRRFASQLKAYSGSPYAPVLENWEEAFNELRTLNESLGIPESLKKVGVDERRFDAMAEDAMKSGNIAVNPRKTTRDDIIKLYRSAY